MYYSLCMWFGSWLTLFDVLITVHVIRPMPTAELFVDSVHRELNWKKNSRVQRRKYHTIVNIFSVHLQKHDSFTPFITWDKANETFKIFRVYRDIKFYCSDFKWNLYVVTYYKVTYLFPRTFLSELNFIRENSRKPCPICLKRPIPTVIGQQFSATPSSAS